MVVLVFVCAELPPETMLNWLSSTFTSWSLLDLPLRCSLIGSIENSLPNALESTLVALPASKVLKKSSVSPKSKSSFLALISPVFC